TVVGQMLGAIDHESAGNLAKQVSTVYEFIFRSLVSAGNRHDSTSLEDAIRVLEIERETWRQLCDKLAAETEAPHEERTPAKPTALPWVEVDSDFAASEGGFSIEA